jgi:RNAse (barnase) inhibitor barstar
MLDIRFEILDAETEETRFLCKDVVESFGVGLSDNDLNYATNDVMINSVHGEKGDGGSVFCILCDIPIQISILKDILKIGRCILVRSVGLAENWYDYMMINSFIIDNNSIYIFGNRYFQFQKECLNLIRYMKYYAHTDVKLWTRLDQKSRYAYLEAAYCMSGIREDIEEHIVMDGHSIVDYNSFFCEFGHEAFGQFGYAGRDLDGLEDVLMNCKTRSAITWKDSGAAFYNIEHTLGLDDGVDRVSIIKEILSIYCDVVYL